MSISELGDPEKERSEGDRAGLAFRFWDGKLSEEEARRSWYKEVYARPPDRSMALSERCFPHTD